MIARIVQFAVGVWLIAASAVLGYGDPLAASERIAGPVAGALAFVAIWEVTRALRWAVAAPALWLAVSAPLLAGVSDPAALNSVACGLVLLATTPFGGATSQRFGGGWRAVLTVD